jgi:predicted O-methyltransferase YrrM
VTGGGSSIAEVQRLLAVLATGRRVAEAGTAFGEGAEAMAKTAESVVTVELDPSRAATAASWAFEHPALAAVEILTTPRTSALVIARR